MTEDDLLRQKNDGLRGNINEVLNNDPELRDLLDEIALKRGEQVQQGMPLRASRRSRQPVGSDCSRFRATSRNGAGSSPAFCPRVRQ
jgi:hypothetical protein